MLMMTLGAYGGCGQSMRQGAESFGPAELVLRGANIPGLAAPGTARTIVISQGLIAAVVSDPGIEPQPGPEAVVVDLQGRTVLPGLIDHHIHLMNVGFSLLNAQTGGQLFLDLSSVHSLQEVERRVRERAAALPPGSWVLGNGWNQMNWGSPRLPTHHVLSRAAPDNPVFLARVDGHAGWVNAAALELAGIRRQTPDMHGGTIGRLDSGEPSGILLERANEPVLEHVPQSSDGRVMRAFRMAAEAMAARGVVEVFDAGFLPEPGIVALNGDFERGLSLLQKAEAEAPLPIRVNVMVPAPSPLADKALAEPHAFRRISGRIRVTHIKLFVDGAFGSRGALLSHAYLDEPATRGVSRMTEGELRAAVILALDAGFDVAVHAIGDAAVHRTLDAFEYVLQQKPDILPGRLRIEHFSYAQTEDIKRAARLKVVLSMQSNFVWPADDGMTMEDARVGTENSRRVYPWGTLLNLGAHLADGSDYFTSPAHTLLNLYFAVGRMNPDGRPDGGWHPEERLSRPAAFRLLTRLYPPGGAKPHIDRLRLGAPADLAILSADPLRTELSELLHIRVHATIRDGRVTYSDGSLPHLR